MDVHRASLVRDDVRTIFLSDVHLGFRYSRSPALLDLLNQYTPQFIYLVGDILDGWRLEASWYWDATYRSIFDRLRELAETGCHIFYTPGNHDDFLRGRESPFGYIQLADWFVHTTADGRRFYVTHGDLFDAVERRFRWLSRFGTRVYNVMMAGNRGLNLMLRSAGMSERNFCASVKVTSKRVTRVFNRYERRLVARARIHECHGVVCGHIHLPRVAMRKDMVYCNTGDWVEHNSALLEFDDGSMQLVNGRRVIGAVSPAGVQSWPLKPRRQLARRAQLRVPS